MSKEMANELRRAFCSAWRFVPADEKEEFKRLHCRVLLETTVGQPGAGDEAGKPSILKMRDADALWGLNSDDQPLRLDLYREQVHKAVGVPGESNVNCGFSSYHDIFRKVGRVHIAPLACMILLSGFS